MPVVVVVGPVVGPVVRMHAHAAVSHERGVVCGGAAQLQVEAPCWTARHQRLGKRRGAHRRRHVRPKTRGRWLVVVVVLLELLELLLMWLVVEEVVVVRDWVEEGSARGRRAGRRTRPGRRR
jgi:hypothetical protein